MLFRLCDAPAAMVVPLLLEQSELIGTVVQSMTQAPLNMMLGKRSGALLDIDTHL